VVFNFYPALDGKKGGGQSYAYGLAWHTIEIA
jgi:hypothetical protein